jgi:hypothetical protein
MSATVDIRRLSAEISSTFPTIDMPPRAMLTAHGPKCEVCDGLGDDLEQIRGQPVSGAAIRLVHQELSHLSPSAWAWILPHYLRFCLSDEGREDRISTEFLIYNLAPELKFQADTAKRLSLLTKDQIRCLIDFLDWCLSQDYWKEFFAADISRATGFLRTLRPPASK